MNNDGTLGIQNWGGYYRPPPLKGNLGLQLMPSLPDRNPKPFFSNLPYPPRECEPSIPFSFTRNIWYNNNRESPKLVNIFDANHYETLIPQPAHTLQMLQQPETPIKDQTEESLSLKKVKKAGKQKKAKKAIASKECANNLLGRGRTAKKSMDMVINGIHLDLSGMPAPVCTCTKNAQQCYRWGAGGWQSACCTTNVSEYPLPMSTKRRGARIAGRKMSQGAFKKVLEKLAGEGQDFSAPIDLKPFWAKHGTNKFVTIR